MLQISVSKVEGAVDGWARRVGLRSANAADWRARLDRDNELKWPKPRKTHR